MFSRIPPLHRFFCSAVFIFGTSVLASPGAEASTITDYSLTGSLLIFPSSGGPNRFINFSQGDVTLRLTDDFADSFVSIFGTAPGYGGLIYTIDLNFPVDATGAGLNYFMTSGTELVGTISPDPGDGTGTAVSLKTQGGYSFLALRDPDFNTLSISGWLMGDGYAPGDFLQVWGAGPPPPPKKDLPEPAALALLVLALGAGSKLTRLQKSAPETERKTL